MEKKKLGGRILFNIILFGFIGQVAWAVENIYFNTFLFNYIGGTADDIAKMVAASAVAAVVTTFIMGTLSDKFDRRLHSLGLHRRGVRLHFAREYRKVLPYFRQRQGARRYSLRGYHHGLHNDLLRLDLE